MEHKVAKLDVDEEEEDNDEELKARLSKHEARFVVKGEDAISLSFPSSQQTVVVGIAYSHQIFPHGRHCGLAGLKIQLQFDSLWRCIDAKETFEEEEEANEGSALDEVRAKLPELFLPQTTSADTIIAWDEHLKTLEGGGGDLADMYWTTEPNRELFERCHAMAMFYIECASQVESFNTHWRMLALQTSSSSSSPLLAGFCTVYEFVNPIRDTKSWRICVVLVLPQFQRRGWAGALVRAVYELAERDGSVIEVTVEDPCAEFVKVKRRVELALAAAASTSTFPWRLPVEFASATTSDVQHFAHKMRFSKSTAQFCFEYYWWKSLPEAVGDDGDAAWKTFRLKIKARLKRERSDLPDCKAYPDDFKQALQELYVEVEQSFRDL